MPQSCSAADEMLHLLKKGKKSAVRACVLSGYAWGLYGSRLPAHHGGGDARLEQANSMSFVCWLMGHILLAVNQRTAVAPALHRGVARNRVFWAWTAATALLCVLVGTTRLDAALSLRRLGGRDWGVAVAVCVAGTCWVEAAKWALLAARKGAPHKQEVDPGGDARDEGSTADAGV